MSVAFKAKFQAANDGPQAAPAMRMPKSGPRVVPLITLRPPKKKQSARRFIPYVLVFFLSAFVSSAVWYAANVLDVLKPPALIPPELPDPERAQGYAETVMPPPANVVAPIPELPALPDDLAKTAVLLEAKDPTTGIALPISSLQAPYPAPPVETPKADPAIAMIAEKIKDTPAMQDDAPQISVLGAEMAPADSQLDQAQAKLDADDDESALAIYDRMLARNPANRAALAGEAAALGGMGRHEAAADAYRRLLALSPKDEMIRTALVSELGMWGAPAASKELQRMVASRPGFAPAQAALAETLVKQDKPLDAIPHAWRASQIEPENILYRLNLAIAYDRLGHSSEAIGFYREVLNNYGAAEGGAPPLPVSLPEIRQRVDYLLALMESAGKPGPAE